MPSRLDAMLAKPGDVPGSDSGEWAYEVKWDGIRALGYARHAKWTMLSRRQEDVTARYPELAGIAEALAGHDAILDGEVVALDAEGRPRFQLIHGNLDHIVVGPTGIYVIETKNYKGFFLVKGNELFYKNGNGVKKAKGQPGRQVMANSMSLKKLTEHVLLCPWHKQQFSHLLFPIRHNKGNGKLTCHITP
jgi:hypothetical protein